MTHGEIKLNILLIGCGRMGSAIAQRWTEAHHVLAYDPAAVIPAGIERVDVLDPAILPRNLIVVLAVKPQAIDAVLVALACLPPAKTLFISLVAGVSLSRLQAGLGGDKRIIRTMPNTPAAVGRGISAAIAGPSVGLAQCRRVEELLRVAGDVVWLASESDMDAVTAVSGSGPAYFYRFTEALARAGAEAGLPIALALRLARATFIGAASLADQRDEDISTLRIEVTSPGGTTAAGLSRMEDNDILDRLLSEAVCAAAARSRQLGN